MSGEFIENPQIDNIESSALRDFFGTWLGQFNEGGLPLSKDFHLTLFAQHLPFIVQSNYDSKAGRFFVKYYGSQYGEGVGADYTNQFVDEIPDAEGLLERSMWLVENRQPYLLLRNKVTWSPKNFRHYNAIACPLFDDEKNVSSIIFRIEFC